MGWSLRSCRTWGFSSAQWFLKLSQTPRGVGIRAGSLRTRVMTTVPVHLLMVPQGC